MTKFKSLSVKTKKISTILATILFIVMLFGYLAILPITYLISNKTNTTNTPKITFEKYEDFETLQTTKEYQELCKKLAAYAACDQAYITCDNARIVQKVNGEYISTNIFTNIFWVWTEKGSETESASYSLEDLGVIYSEYDCTTADIKTGYIIPEKNIQKACRLSPEVEEALGYSTEEIVEIYIRRFKVNEEDYYPHSKFRTIPCE